MAEIKAVSVRTFELFALDGTSLGLFKVESEWQGLRKLVSVGSPLRVVIVTSNETKIDEVLSDVFGEHRLQLTVVKASPDLLETLQ